MRGRTLSEAELAATRVTLTQVALRIVDTEGREEASLRRVASEAGLSRSTPYTYFPDKEALMDAARVAAIHQLADGCEAALSKGESVADRLREVGRAYVAFALDHPALYALIFEDHTGGPAYEVAVARYRSLAEAPLVEAYAQGLVSLPPDRLATVLWASTHGLLALRRSGKLRVDFEDALKELGDTLAFGFVPRQKGAL